MHAVTAKMRAPLMGCQRVGGGSIVPAKTSKAQSYSCTAAHSQSKGVNKRSAWRRLARARPVTRGGADAAVMPRASVRLIPEQFALHCELWSQSLA